MHPVLVVFLVIAILITTGVLFRAIRMNNFSRKNASVAQQTSGVAISNSFPNNQMSEPISSSHAAPNIRPPELVFSPFGRTQNYNPPPYSSNEYIENQPKA